MPGQMSGRVRTKSQDKRHSRQKCQDKKLATNCQRAKIGTQVNTNVGTNVGTNVSTKRRYNGGLFSTIRRRPVLPSPPSLLLSLPLLLDSR